jgi:AraC family transcriptional regulator
MILNSAESGRKPFDVRQTHGILWRSEHQIERSSDRLGWSSLYVSRQHEQPYADTYQPVQDHLVILHLDGPVAVERRFDGHLNRALIGPGGIFTMPGGADFWVHLTQPLHSVHFYVRDSILREVAADAWSGDPTHIELTPGLGEVDPVMGSIIRTAGQALLDEDGNSELLADYLARALASRLIANTAGQTAKARSTGAALNPAQQRRLRAFVATHLAYPIGLADLASAVGLTPTRFARGFKRDTGTTPYHYVLTARLQRAKTMLRTTNMPIAEIALACGFSHQEHLTRMFGREMGITPAAYRRSTHA